MDSFIKYKNTIVSFSVIGEGSAVILLHGFLEGSSMWDFVVSEIAKRNKVITIDLLGHGKSGCLGYVHSMEEMAEAVKAVLKFNRMRKATFIGHSMGGYVALAFAEKYPEAVKGLCLMNATSQADTEERKLLRLRAIKMAHTNYEALVAMSIINLFVEEIRKVLLKEIEVCRQVAAVTSVQGYIACASGMRIRENREHVLESSTYKKMYILGERDPILKYKELKEEAIRTKSAVVSLPCGHMSHIEEPKELLSSIISFLKKK